ncbi:MAG: SDR family NAD(P)-dependent oxidoreductase, partial [Burkholderiales bacterium]
MNTLLIAGFGDIAQRALPLLAARFHVTALVRPERVREIQTRSGFVIEPGDLDDPASLRRFAGRASHVLHCAPPAGIGTT